MGEGKLKPGWTRVAFGDVVRLSKERTRDPLGDGLDRYVGLEHLEPGELKIRSWGNTADGITFTNRFRPGQVLFGKRRAYQRKVAVADFEGVCSGDIYILEPSSDLLLLELLPFICQTDAFFEKAIGTSAGSLSPRTNWQHLSKFEFSLPPIGEQERMVELLTAVEEVRVELQRVEQYSLLIRKALAENIISNALPSELVPISKLCDPARPICYGVIQPGINVEDGVPMLRVCDLEFNPIDYESLKRIDPEIHKKFNRSVIRSGDVLVSVVGTIGRIHVVTEAEKGFNIARAIARIAPHSTCIPSYLALILESPSLQRSMSAEAFESARKTLNLSSLEKIRVPLPNISTQKKIVQVGDQVGLEEHFFRERIKILSRLPQILWR